MPIPVSDKLELIPGYTTNKRIGAGGYGEVWEVTAPGGLKKAIKLVYGYVNEERAARELKALKHITQVRHPYLLSLERIEIIDDRLMVVTELADRSLMDRFEECRSDGLAGVPRAELVRYLRDAAEALDYMVEHHGLQHLDIKPENLLLLCDHTKVADFGLVKDVVDPAVSCIGGLTPSYAAPETFSGSPSRHSDQYSLAVVYQHVLTGVLPFPGRTSAQLTAQHTNFEPQLSALPECDRGPVGRALSKMPEDRFPCCCDFVNALAGISPSSSCNYAPQRPARNDEDADFQLETNTSNNVVTEIGQPIAGESEVHPRAVTEQLGHGEEPHDVAADPPQVPNSESQPVPNVRVETTVSELTPVDTECLSLGLRPTLVIGVGGTGARVLGWLQRRFNNRLHAEYRHGPQLLLLETDPNTITAAQQGRFAAELRDSDTLFLPLRRPSVYRTVSQRYSKWLGRRWLYNVPPSLKTEGFRPLGRLAYVDHAEEVENALRERLQHLVSPDATRALEKATSLPPGRRDPRVFIVGSISGGTAGGMMLDIAQLVKDILRDYGASTDGVIGILTHSTNTRRRDGNLALANAYATLSELRHISCCNDCSESEARDGVEGRTPFFGTYFVNLGHQLGEKQLDRNVGVIAEFLYFNTATTLGSLLDRCRDQAGTGVEAHDLKLRSFGLSMVNARKAGHRQMMLSKAKQMEETMYNSLMGCGFYRRSVIVASSKSKHALEQSNVAKWANIVTGSHRHTVICGEAEQLSLAQIAHRLTDGRPDIIAAANRLFTRKDITWSEMPIIQSVDG